MQQTRVPYRHARAAGRPEGKASGPGEQDCRAGAGTASTAAWLRLGPPLLDSTRPTSRYLAVSEFPSNYQSYISIMGCCRVDHAGVSPCK